MIRNLIKVNLMWMWPWPIEPKLFNLHVSLLFTCLGLVTFQLTNQNPETVSAG